MTNGIRTIVISIVTAVWAINFTAPIFVKDYTPSPELNVAFMAIIGVLTASYKLDKNNQDDNKKDPPKPPDSENTDGNATP
jgi:hypothetical protein